MPRTNGVRPLPEQPARQAERSASPDSIRGLSDQELLEGLRESSELHFNELYRRYFQRIYNFTYGRVRNHADVEEIVQETFTAVFRSVEAYRGQSSLLSWIYGIAKNTINNQLRRNKVQEQKKERVEAELARPDSALVSDTPEDQLNLRRYTDEIRSRLESVASWQAEIFVMRHLENLSIAEISERTDRSSDAIRSSLYRVKRLLIEAVDPPMSATGS
ncbi:MAG: RNA polymerase sigma factor [Myxococcota bacterium]